MTCRTPTSHVSGAWTEPRSGHATPRENPERPGTALSAAVKLMIAHSRENLLDQFALPFANYPDRSPFYPRNVGTYRPEFSHSHWTGPDVIPAAYARHHEGKNTAFLDGHVRSLPYQAFTGPFANDTVGRWCIYWQQGQ